MCSTCSQYTDIHWVIQYKPSSSARCVQLVVNIQTFNGYDLSSSVIQTFIIQYDSSSCAMIRAVYRMSDVWWLCCPVFQMCDDCFWCVMTVLCCVSAVSCIGVGGQLGLGTLEMLLSCCYPLKIRTSSSFRSTRRWGKSHCFSLIVLWWQSPVPVVWNSLWYSVWGSRRQSSASGCLRFWHLKQTLCIWDVFSDI